MEPSSERDRSLVARIAAGDQAAADGFDERYRARLLRFCQSRGIPSQDQNDLVQDVLLAAFEKIRAAEFRGESSLGTWLMGILNHKIADYWERAQRESGRLVPLEGSPDATTRSRLDRMPDTAPLPDVRLALEEILDALPRRHRVLLLLNVREGLTTDEIAAVLKMHPGTVGRILWEAKRLLSGKGKMLKKLGPEGD